LRTFTLRLQDATHAEDVTGVISFVGEDASGSFGILAGHARLIAVLVMGLARFRTDDETWRYLAVPGAVLYFRDDLLSISARRYLVDDDYTRISTALDQQLLAEEIRLQTLKDSLRNLDEQVLRHLSRLSRTREI